MKAKSMVLIMIALGCGLVASIGISQVVMDRGSGGAPQAETVPILVAMVDIDINDPLTSENVKLEQWPKDKVPPGAVSDLANVSEKYTAARLYAGEPILMAKLNDQSGQIPIPEGYRVLPVKISADVVSQFVQPGDRVDILVFLRQSGEIKSATVMTVLKNVRVFAVGSKMERQSDDEGQSFQAKTVSLLVKPRQCEKLSLVSELGRLRLTLRRHNDPSDEEVNYEPLNLSNILHGGVESASPRQLSSDGNSNDAIKKLLEEMKSRNQQQPVAPQVAHTNRNTKRMTILGPDGPQEVYTFDEQNKVIHSQALPGAAAVNSPPPNPQGPNNQAPPENKKPENDSQEKPDGQHAPADDDKE